MTELAVERGNREEQVRRKRVTHAVLTARYNQLKSLALAVGRAWTAERKRNGWSSEPIPLIDLRAFLEWNEVPTQPAWREFPETPDGLALLVTAEHHSERCKATRTRKYMDCDCWFGKMVAAAEIEAVRMAFGYSAEEEPDSGADR